MAFATNPASQVLLRFELDGLNAATEALGGNQQPGWLSMCDWSAGAPSE
jgi:hypothetical protein